MLIVHFTLVLLLSRVIITRNEWTCWLLLLWSSNFWKLLQRFSSFLLDKNQFIQEKIFNKVPVRRIAFAMNTNSAFTRSCTENAFWCQQFDLRQNEKLERGQPIVNFDDGDTCRFYVTTMKAESNELSKRNPSIPIDSFKDHYVLVFDLTPMQDAIEKCHYPDLVGERLRLALLRFTFPLKHVTELIVLGERMSSVNVDKFGVVGKTSTRDNFLCSK